jgi:hypothetical protein
MFSSILPSLLSAFGFMIPIAAGIIATAAVQALKLSSAALDKTPAWTKQTASALIATVVVVAANALGVEVIGNPAEWDMAVPKDQIQALVAALIAHVIHSGKKQDERKAFEVAQKRAVEWANETKTDPFKLPE